MESAVTFGGWLRRRRRTLDMTQQELADCAGCSLVTIRKFESDERRPSKLLAELLAGCLDIPDAERERFIRFARRADTDPYEPPPDVPEPRAPLPEKPAAPPVAPPASRPLRGNLPAPLTALIGREDDVAQVVALLAAPDVRLLTLTGPGGAGKTRLALAAARALAEARPDLALDGAYFVDLSAVAEAGGVLFAVARSLGASEHPELDVAAAIAEHVRRWQALIVFDNYEHVLDAAGHVVDLLLAAPGLTLLVTSREPLLVYGEHEYPVGPLAVPDGGAITVAAAEASPAVALFAARSRAANRAFQLTPDNVAAVVAICRRLDGLPLAIELAAAQSRRFDPPELLAGLDAALDLGGPARHTPERQLSLRQAIDWSYRLLSDAEQRLFRRLGLFGGAFGAAEVAALLAEAGEAPDAADLARRLDDLTSKSMARWEREGGDRPYRLLFVVREFAREQLAATGELADGRRRHRAYVLALADRAARGWGAGSGEAARELLPPATDDIRAALDWSLGDPAEANAGLALAVRLAEGDYWIGNNMMAEGAEWLARGLATAAPEPELRAAALVSAGRLAVYRDRPREAVELGRAGLELLATLGDAADADWLIVGRRVVANAASSLGDVATHFDLHERNIAVFRQRGDAIGEANALEAMGLTAMEIGDTARAADYLGRAVALLRSRGDRTDLLLALNGLGVALLVTGDYAAAEPPLREALALAGELGVTMWQVMVQANLGHLLLPQGRLDEARSLLERAAILARDEDDGGYGFQAELGLATAGLLAGDPPAVVWPHLAECLRRYEADGRIAARFQRLADVLALFWARQGQAELAAQLIACGDAVREAARRWRYANVQPIYEQALASIAAQLDEAARAAAVARGRSARPEDLVAEVMALGDGV